MSVAAAALILACCTVGAATAATNDAARAASLPKAGSSTIWVETEAFADRGGWYPETQFVPFMGSAYLMAAGLGTPVPDAATTVHTPSSGTHVLWARTKNWVPEHSPGRFQILVNGTTATHTFGTADTEEWTWERGGELNLAKGSVSIALRDLTGYYGRCDAILLTTDQDYVPPSAVEDIGTAREAIAGPPPKPKNMGRFDCVVVGGGVGGTIAALSAAQFGLKTALIQNRPVLGGNASTEIRVGVAGASAGGRNRNMRETGLVDALHVERARLGSWDEALKQACDRERRLHLFLNTHQTDVMMRDRSTIAAARAIDTVTLQPMVFRGKVFIDCTGDGCLAAAAGADMRWGREAHNEYAESMAPEAPDRETMGSSLMYTTRNVGHGVPFEPPPWAIAYTEEDLHHRNHSQVTSGFWWIEWGGNIDTIHGNEQIRDFLLRALYGLWAHIKNDCVHKDRAANLMLARVNVVVGKRESRRILGDYMMRQHDVQNRTLFPDRVTYGGWPIDIHPGDGIQNPGRPNVSIPVEPYSIPFRSLYSRNISNLLMAGRNISVTHVALGTTRVMGTIGLQGQAVGTAAYLCRKHRTTPRGVYERHIAELQRLLIRNDVAILGMPDTDPANLALEATATASSTAGAEVYDGWHAATWKYHEFTHYRGQMFPVSADRIDVIGACLQSTSERPIEVTMRVRQADAPNDWASTKDIATAQATLPPKHAGWVSFKVEAQVDPQKPVWFFLPKTAGLRWYLLAEPLPSAFRAYSSDAKSWTPASGNYAFAVDPPISWPIQGAPGNAIDGQARADDESTHMWISDPSRELPQWLEIDFGRPVKFNAVDLTFDTALNLPRVTACPLPQTVRDYRLLVESNGEWRTIATIEGNYLRFRRHTFKAVRTSKLRVIVDATNGDKSARIYEVAVYTRSV